MTGFGTNELVNYRIRELQREADAERLARLSRERDASGRPPRGPLSGAIAHVAGRFRVGARFAHPA